MQEFARVLNYCRMQINPFLEGLNEAQCEAVMHGEGPALVAAGPGSGKTLTIIRRLLYLIYMKNVPAEKILVITFTKEAAKSMQEKFYEQLQKFGLKTPVSNGFISFGTFHSYFYQIIKSISKYSEYQLITRQEKEKLAKIILEQNTQEEVTQYSVKNLLDNISYYKNTGKQKTEKDILGIVNQYQSALQFYKKLDFDDMLYLCKKELMEDKRQLEHCQKRFNYILIDEYQDINYIQYEIINLLVNKHQNLFVVGDDDQAIYGFRGSDTQSFQKFIDDYPDAKNIYLVKNYRCCHNIVEASKRLIENNKCRVDKEFVSAKNNALMGHIEAIGASNNRECYEMLRHKLSVMDVDTLNQQAMLFRTNAAMQSCASFLTGKNIPFVLRENIKSIYEHFIANDIFDYFLAANGNCERSIYLRIFQKSMIGREALRTETIDLKQVKKFYAQGFYENGRMVEMIEILERQLKRLAGMRPKLGIQYILHGMDYQGHLLRKAGNQKEITQEWMHVLEWLKDDAADFITFQEWLEHKEAYQKVLEKEGNVEDTDKKGIHLMTLHSSKGLEFTKIYMLGLNEGNIPQYHKGESISKEKIEEERRLCYVGITRAKDEAELYYLTGTKENPALISRFVEELGLL